MIFLSQFVEGAEKVLVHHPPFLEKGEAIGTPFYKPGDTSFDLAIGSVVKNFEDKSEEHFEHRLASMNVPGNVARDVGAAVPSAYKNAKNFEENGKISEAWVSSTMMKEWDEKGKKKYQDKIQREIEYLELEKAECIKEETKNYHRARDDIDSMFRFRNISIPEQLKGTNNVTNSFAFFCRWS